MKFLWLMKKIFLLFINKEKMAIKLCSEEIDLCWQVSIGAKFGPLVSRGNDLIEELLLGNLFGIARKPDSPGIRGTANANGYVCPRFACST